MIRVSPLLFLSSRTKDRGGIVPFRGLILTLTLGLGAGLVGCQDNGAVAPDDLTASFAVNCDNKPNHPKCPGGGDPPTGGNTASLTLTGGMTGDGQGLEVIADNGNRLSIRAPSSLKAQLTNSVEHYSEVGNTEPGQYGGCRAKPADTSLQIVQLLRDQLDYLARPWDIMDGSRVEIKKKHIGEPSEGHFIALNYDTGTPELNLVFLRVGDAALFDGPLTTVTDLGDGSYEFSGGTVWVGAKIGPVGSRPFLECPLEDPVNVQIVR